ncbi:MAG: Glutamate-tRNA ligase [Candidatus Magasanikbacteria bacterium GW2011_GWA2_45_39]|uniref:Glutamate--tRNA ligase n=3 Tax=Candidatus Magasanikiibacteriota TaxID=1752731 RepID=A0A0G1PPA7_9BACT|nr:MAG: Glutamate-tRNA ligase [Candidatus Magasanikbacteria bacterium GW2011_GWA2_45_39]HBW73907.1 glutamate--tRNA ligase [Candidatus Magasanikbacteria bacterium]
MTKQAVRVRFAPSPTGYLHVGGLRTALYNFLFARKHNGIFILRIEDTDQTRKVEGALEHLIRTLGAVGLSWDEGPHLSGDTITEHGDFGPYIQSARTSIYRQYAEKLIESGSAYYCFCAAERLDSLRKRQQLNKLPTIYDRFCATQGDAYVAEKLASGAPHVIRLKMLQTGVTVFEDIVRGRVEFENKLIDDQVLLKSDGFPTYHLANVVDDHLMEISHVIRAEEWISSTPKHLTLYQALGWKPPEYAHVPLLFNPDKSKLSKRQGDVAAEDYLRKGYLPEALLNFLALLGWNSGTEKELFTLEELVKEFDLKKVQKSGAIFSTQKLDWFNTQYIKEKSAGELAELVKPYLVSAELIPADFNDEAYLKEVVSLCKDRMKTLAEIVDLADLFFKDIFYDPLLLVWKKSTPEATRVYLQTLKEFIDSWTGEWQDDSFEKVLLEFIKEKQWGNGDVLWPLRVALSGKKASPGPFEIARVVGKERVSARVQKAFELLG